MLIFVVSSLLLCKIQNFRRSTCYKNFQDVKNYLNSPTVTEKKLNFRMSDAFPEESTRDLLDQSPHDRESTEQENEDVSSTTALDEPVKQNEERTPSRADFTEEKEDNSTGVEDLQSNQAESEEKPADTAIPKGIEARLCPETLAWLHKQNLPLSDKKGSGSNIIDSMKLCVWTELTRTKEFSR